ncbi:MAG: hypothetical protein JRH01_14665 [Deltaproteobacteria bacterium]|nr:hypothetical protein [Deltaproteobacteria bacterium]
MIRLQPLRSSLLWVALIFALPGLSACGGEAEDPAAALARRGQAIFESVCTACHARDPSQPGPVGPEVAGASLELLRAKVLHNEYPPGHVPKRDTQAMVPLPHLETDLPAIEAYLATFNP